MSVELPRSRRPRVVIIGAGAAGSMAAIFAAAAGAETILVERSHEGGRKILISGGGRCNVLPMRVDESRYVTDSSPNVLRKILRSWPLAEQIAFFENELQIPLVEEPEVQKLFPKSQRARDIRDALLAASARHGATLLTDTLVTNFLPTERGWRVELATGAPLEAEALVIATGGLSVPNTGSDGLGLRVLASLGHPMNPTYPALTPLTVSESPFKALSGISLPVTLTARSGERSATSSGGFLFTHHGYSGPSVLDVSHLAARTQREAPHPPTRISVRWTGLGEAEWTAALRPVSGRTILAAVRQELPERLAAVLVAMAEVDPSRLLADLRREERRRLAEVLTRGPLPWSGDEGYRKAEVTGGGVSLAAIDPRTMESRRHPGLFICGEVLDAFGPIGGYNFLWAWATGRAAGLGAAGVSADRSAAKPTASPSWDAAS
jgi:predicted Rossmann fold flavoprotein